MATIDQDQLVRAEVPAGERHSLAVTHMSSETAWDVAPHVHEQYEVVFYKSIDATCEINGTSIQLKPNTMIIVPPYSLHLFKVSEGASSFSANQCDLEFIKEFVDEDLLPTDASFITLDSNTFETIWSLLELHWTIRNDKSSSFKTSLARTIWSWIFEKARENEECKTIPESRFRPFIEYMLTEKVYQLNAEKAAELCSLSRSRFLAAFKEQFKINYNEFLIQRKVAVAKHLLATTKMKVAEIADELNFNNSSYLISVFRKNTGMTPKDYRKQL